MSTQTTVGSSSTSSNDRNTANTLQSKGGVNLYPNLQWIKQVKRFGKRPTCRICGKLLQREDTYFRAIQSMTICETCVEKFAVKIKEANDLLRNNLSEF